MSTFPAPTRSTKPNRRSPDDLLDEIITSFQAGEPVDLDALLRDFPEDAEQIRRLIPALEALGSLHSEAPASTPAGSDTAADKPRTLGDFRILREIGRGGMGVVYEAEQLSLGRRVALKVLPFAAVMDPRQLARFKTEAQAAALLQHQNIVPVYGVGCERGVHYYSMQYIEGHTLAELVGELRRTEGLEQKGESHQASSASALASRLLEGQLRGGELPSDEPPSAAESTRKRHPTEAAETPARAGLSTGSSTKSARYVRSIVDLGIQAAGALDHAHEHGIVHRDVKPGNLMLDGRGNLWITDFGLARIEANPGLTMTGDLLGTLRYMSPEQALAKRAIVDHRADIYSLGVTLYELLTLHAAFPGDNRQEVLNRIATEEPVRLRRLNPSVPLDLETIVCKAIAKAPEDRYDTAKDLADDLQSFLDNKPIQARRPSMAQRTGKWAQRHRALLSVGVITAVVSLGIAMFFVLRERSAAVEQKGIAEKNFQLARDAVDRMYTRVAKELENFPRSEPVRRAVLEDALEFYLALLEQRKEQPSLRFETAKAYERVGTINAELGDWRSAAAACDELISILTQLLAEHPGSEEYRQALIRAHGGRTSCCIWTGEVEQSIEHHHKQIALQQQIVREHPKQKVQKFVLAQMEAGLGVTLGLITNTDLKQGEAHLRHALAVYQQLEPPSFTRVLVDSQASAHHYLGAILQARHRLEEAEEEMRESRRLNREGMKRKPEDRNYMVTLSHIEDQLSRVLYARGKTAEAVEASERALALQKRVCDLLPLSANPRRRLARCYEGSVRPLLAAGREADSEQAARAAVAEIERLALENPETASYQSDLASFYQDLGNLLFDLGKAEEASDVFRKAAEIYDETVGKFPGLRSARYLYGTLLTTCPDRRFRDPQRALVLAEGLLRKAPKYSYYRALHGQAAFLTGDDETAIESLLGAEQSTDFLSVPDSLRLAISFWKVGNRPKAKQWYEQAVERRAATKLDRTEIDELHAEAVELMNE